VLKTNSKIMLIVAVILLISSIAFAIPGIPNAFYGSVAVNDAPASDGTTVTAKINGAIVATTTTSAGSYSFYVDDPNNNRNGKTINFFVNDVDTGKTAIFNNDGSVSVVREVNLSATITTPPSTGGSGGGGGGGGGGSSGSSGSTVSPGTTISCNVSYDFSLGQSTFNAVQGDLVTVPVTINMKNDCGAPRDVQLDLTSPLFNFTRIEKLVSNGTKATTLSLFVPKDAAPGDYSGKVTSGGVSKDFSVSVGEAQKTEITPPLASQGFSITGMFAGIGTDPVATGAVIAIVIIIILIVAYFLMRSRRRKKK